MLNISTHRNMTRHRYLLIGVVVALVLYPFAASYLQMGIASVHSWFAADAFYYLAIAKNAAWDPLFSFDGIHSTNGFHPLWQVYLKASFSAFEILSSSQGAQILFAHLSGVVCIAIAAVILFFILHKWTKCAWLAVIAIVPGLLYFPVALADQFYGSLWSYVNGTESAFSLLLFSCLVLYIVRSNFYDSSGTRKCVPIAILVTGLVLARLDDVFMIPALCAPVVLSQLSLKRKATRLLILVGVPGFVILTYCLVNYAYAGTPLPVSGQIKGDASWRYNLFRLLSVFVPVREQVAGSWHGWRPVTWRVLHNLLPVVGPIVFLFSVFRRGRITRLLSSNSVSLLSAVSVYVIAKAAYNFIFVGLWHQGHWYYPVSFCISSMVMAVLLSSVIPGDCRQAVFNVEITNPVLRRVIWVAFTIIGIGLFAEAARLSVHDAVSSPGRVGDITRSAGIAVCVVAAFMIGVIALHVRRKSHLKLSVPLGMIAVILIALFASNAMLAMKAETKYNEEYYRFWINRDSICAELRDGRDVTGILSFDDGIVAYSLDVPVMSGLGFTLDYPAVLEMKAGRLLDVAYSRGFSMLTSVAYMPEFQACSGQDVTDELSRAFWLAREDVMKWSFRVAHIDANTGCKFIEFRPVEIGVH